MARRTGTAPPACRVPATLAAAPLRFRLERARAHGARTARVTTRRAGPRRARPEARMAAAVVLVSSGRGMSEMLLRPAGWGGGGWAGSPASAPLALLLSLAARARLWHCA